MKLLHLLEENILELNKSSIVKKTDKDLQLYTDISKSLSKLRLVEFKFNLKRYGNNSAQEIYYYKKIQDKKLLKRLSKRLNIKLLF